ncbi:MAG: glycosyltransferase family 2 protein [Pseudodesulfovibrio sp.]
MGNANVLVSVVIPTYNRAELLMDTISSVLEQTHQHLEVLVIDDGSTDDTKEQVAALANPRIRYIKTENTGLPASARNTGIAMAKGEFIAFLDSDDLWLPEKLEKQIARLHKTGMDWCNCDYHIFSHDTGKNTHLRSDTTQPAEGMVAEEMFLTNRVGSPTPIVRKQIFDEVGMFDTDTSLRFVEDWDMWLRIAATHPLCYVNEALARYRVHASNSTNWETVYNTAIKSFTVATKAAKLFPETYAPLLASSIRTHCQAQTKKLLASGETHLARKLLRTAAGEAGSYKGLRLLMLASMIPTWVLLAYSNQKQ